jgi:hypothetical protein
MIFLGANFDKKIWFEHMQSIFHEKKNPNSLKLEKFLFELPDFHCRFRVARNIEKALKFFYFHILFIIKFG